MRIYCVLFDSAPLSERFIEIAQDKKASVIKQVANAFTTTSVVSMLTGKLPSDLLPGGIGWNTPGRYGTVFPWNDELIINTMEKIGWRITLHNSHWFNKNVCNNKNFTNTTCYPGGLEAEGSKWWDHPDIVKAMIGNTKATKAYYAAEKKHINSIQTSEHEYDEFYFIIYHQYHAACGVNSRYNVAADRLAQLMGHWDFDEPDAMYWFFSDHGNYNYIDTYCKPPHSWPTWAIVKDNTQKPIKVEKKLISIRDFYPTVKVKLELGTDFPSDAEPLCGTQNRERTYFVEDGRGQIDPLRSTTACAIKGTRWENDHPGVVTQVSYHEPEDRFMCFEFDIEKSIVREVKTGGVVFDSLKEALIKRFDWVRSDKPIFSRRKDSRQSVRKDSGEIVSKIRSNILKLIPMENVLKKVNPYHLLTHNRFDLLAKIIYARHRELGVDSPWAKDLYTAHLKVFNGFREPDGTGKVGIDAFSTAFHQTLDSIRQRGFDNAESLIPVGRNNVILDGSHRIAACLLYNKELTGFFCDTNAYEYDYNFFRNYTSHVATGLSSKWCDAMALEYCRLKENTYIVSVFPSAVGHDDRIREILIEHGKIFYEKAVFLKNQGPTLLMKQMYSGESWVGDWKNHFIGAQQKAALCFTQQGPTRVYFLEADTLEQVQEAKCRLRDIFRIENHAVHINDTHRETIRLAQIFLNDNSIHFINHAQPKYYEAFHETFIYYKEWLTSRAIDQEYFCIDGSAVMAVYGIRASRDLDFLHFERDNISTGHPLVTSHNSEIHHHSTTMDDIIFNPDNHFYYDGVKFASLSILRAMKEKRAEDKDRIDIALIDAVMASDKKLYDNAVEVNKEQLVSIIILNFNGAAHIEKCIESIKAHTDEPYELIVVDNASTDNSLAYLRTLKDITLVENPENLGCPPARTQAMALARGEYVVLLDNDTIVTPGWLTTFCGYARRNPTIGLFGPCSNHVIGLQKVDEVPYEDVQGLEAFARTFSDQNRGCLTIVPRLVGFCMFIRRAVVDRIGAPDPRFGKFGFEDDDYVWRAIIAGFQAAIAQDIFIHHIGGPQVKGDTQYNRYLLDAWEIFKAKWDLPADLECGTPLEVTEYLAQPFDMDKHFIPVPDKSSIEELITTYGDGSTAGLPSGFQQDLEQRLDTGEQQFAAGNSRAAEEIFAGILVDYPDQAQAHNNLGVLYYANGDKEKALHHYRQAVRFSPENIIFQKNLADFYSVVLGRIEDALRIYVKVLAAQPTDIETLLITGHICVALHRFDDAKVFYDRVLEIDPGNMDAKAES